MTTSYCSLPYLGNVNGLAETMLVSATSKIDVYKKNYKGF